MNAKKTADICRQIHQRLEAQHIRCFRGRKEPLLLISTQYPGVWLEHVYDSVMYARLDSSKLYLAKNTLSLFLEYQRPDGQLPCYVWDGNLIPQPPEKLVGYSQIQECVSFGRLCLEVFSLDGDRTLLEKCYRGVTRWIGWLERNRMTLGMGLIEMFCGYDTGHDNSGRLEGIACKGSVVMDGQIMDAAVPPPVDGITPILAVDMNCNFYRDILSAARMADILGLESKHWYEKAAAVKEALFRHCYDPADAFFYDTDRQGRKRRVLSCTVFHLFMEGFLDPRTDAGVIEEIYRRHIKNEAEFWTPCPFPSVAACDPSAKNHVDFNSWGYFSQALIALRCTLWMDHYGFGADFDILCEKWLEALTDCFDDFKLGQELDPFTAKPSRSSQWYSSCMLFYLYAAKRLGVV